MTSKSTIKEFVNQRFIEVCDLLKKIGRVRSNAEIYKAIEMQSSNFSDIKTGTKSITIQAVSLFKAAYPEINIDYIISGQGSPIRTQQNKLAIASDYLGSYNGHSDSQMVSIPMINYRVAANHNGGYLNDEKLEVSDKIIIPQGMLRSKNNFGLQVVGDSMFPTILDNDWVICGLVQKGDYDQIKNKYVYVIVTKERGTVVKRVLNRLKSSGWLSCQSDNPKHPTFTVLEDDILEVWEVKLKLSAHLININEDVYTRLNDLEEQFINLTEKQKN